MIPLRDLNDDSSNGDSSKQKLIETLSNEYPEKLGEKVLKSVNIMKNVHNFPFFV